MNRNYWFFVGGINGLKRLATDSFHPFSINVQTKRLIIGDGGRHDSLTERHDDWYDRVDSMHKDYGQL